MSHCLAPLSTLNVLEMWGVSLHSDLDTVGVALLALDGLDAAKFHAHIILKDSIAVKNL